MKNQENIPRRLALVLLLAVVGAALMLLFDGGGTRWLKFLLYIIFFTSIFSPSLFVSSSSCGFLARMRKRS
jgi:hypothetical protein